MAAIPPPPPPPPPTPPPPLLTLALAFPDNIVPLPPFPHLTPTPATDAIISTEALEYVPVRYSAMDMAAFKPSLVTPHALSMITVPVQYTRYFTPAQMRHFITDETTAIAKVSRRAITPADDSWGPIAAACWNSLPVHKVWRTMVRDYEHWDTGADYYRSVLLRGSTNEHVPIFGGRGGTNDLEFMVNLYKEPASCTMECLMSAFTMVAFRAWLTINQRHFRYAPGRGRYSEAMPRSIVLTYPAQDFQFYEQYADVDRSRHTLDLYYMATITTISDFVLLVLRRIQDGYPIIDYGNAKCDPVNWCRTHMFKQFTLWMTTAKYTEIPMENLMESFNSMTVSMNSSGRQDVLIRTQQKKWYPQRTANFWELKVIYPTPSCNRSAAWAVPVFLAHILGGPNIPTFRASGDRPPNERHMIFGWDFSMIDGKRRTGQIIIAIRRFLKDAYRPSSSSVEATGEVKHDVHTDDGEENEYERGDDPSTLLFASRKRKAVVTSSSDTKEEKKRKPRKKSTADRDEADSTQARLCFTRNMATAPFLDPLRRRYLYHAATGDLQLPPPVALTNTNLVSLSIGINGDERSPAYFSTEFIRYCGQYGTSLLLLEYDAEDSKLQPRLRYSLSQSPAGEHCITFHGPWTVSLTNANDGSPMPQHHRFIIERFARYEYAATPHHMYLMWAALCCIGYHLIDIVHTMLIAYGCSRSDSDLQTFQASLAKGCTEEETHIAESFFSDQHPMSASMRMKALDLLTNWDRKSAFTLPNQPGLGLVEAEDTHVHLPSAHFYINGSGADRIELVRPKILSHLNRIRSYALLGYIFDPSIVHPPELTAMVGLCGTYLAFVKDSSATAIPWLEFCRLEYNRIYGDLWFPCLSLLRTRTAMPIVKCARPNGRVIDWQDINPNLTRIERIAATVVDNIRKVVQSDPDDFIRQIKECRIPRGDVPIFLKTVAATCSGSSDHAELVKEASLALDRCASSPEAGYNQTPAWVQCRRTLIECLTTKPNRITTAILTQCHAALMADTAFSSSSAASVAGGLTAAERIVDIFKTIVMDPALGHTYYTILAGQVKAYLTAAATAESGIEWPTNIIMSRLSSEIHRWRGGGGNSSSAASSPSPVPFSAVISTAAVPIRRMHSGAPSPPPLPSPGGTVFNREPRRAPPTLATVVVGSPVSAIPIVATLASLPPPSTLPRASSLARLFAL